MGSSGYLGPCCRGLLLATLLCVQFSEISSLYFTPQIGPGADVPFYQQFCQRRNPTCCPGRDDSCNMPIRNHICYCDIFCNRTIADCCPDFWGHCLQIAPPTGAQTVPPDITPCSIAPCKNGGVCQVVGQHDYRCSCPGGWTGKDCDINQNPCQSYPCKNGAECVNTQTGYVCRCRPGFHGPNCDNKVDACLSNPCQNGQCRPAYDGFYCVCRQGYQGNLCQYKIDPCLSRPCRNGGACRATPNGYFCTCGSGWGGINCEEDIDPCRSNPCRNGGRCLEELGGFKCRCMPGFAGVTCEQNTNACTSNPCRNGGVCRPITTGYYCSCRAGFEGKDCQNTVQNPCLPNPCQNGGVCKESANGYYCTCRIGYDGKNCQTNTDSCRNNPCLNGGRCQDTLEGFRCTCRAGYEGPTCRNRVDSGCSPNPCRNGGMCKEAVGGYYCVCAQDFGGKNCDQNLNACGSNPCRNGGRCRNSLEGYYCTCDVGYDGKNCENDVDPCRSNPCNNGGRCRNTVEGPHCTCRTGYGGPTCNEDLDPCRSRPCRNGGKCLSHADGYICTCPIGYEGVNCDRDIDECASNPCMNGGICRDHSGKFTCRCLDGFGGTRCEIDLNPCKSNPCRNGQCRVVPGGYVCDCEPGYEGVNCQSEIFECSSNPCQHGVCTDRVNGYQCSCDINWSGVNCDRGPDQCVLPETPVAPENDDSEGATRFGVQDNSREEYDSLPRIINIRSNISLEFKTSASDGVMYYMANSRHEDFVALFMKDGRIYHAFDCGSGTGFMSTRRTYNDNQWHTVVFSRERKEGELVVDGSDTTRGMSLGSSRTISVSPPYFVGGLSAEAAEDSRLVENLQGVTNSLSGCIRNVKLYDIMFSNPQGHFTAPCSSVSEPGSFFGANGGFLVASERFEVGQDLDISIEVRGRSLNGVILSVRSSNGEYLVLQMVDGSIVFNVKNDPNEKEVSATWRPRDKGNNKNFLCDGQWHLIKAVKAKEVVTLRVDSGGISFGTGQPGLSQCETNDPLYVGGYERTHAGIRGGEPFVGCLKNLMLNNVPTSFSTGRRRGNVTPNSCPIT